MHFPSGSMSTYVLFGSPLRECTRRKLIMKHRLFSILVLIVVFALGVATVQGSGALPSSGWWTKVTVQSLADATAINLTAYDGSNPAGITAGQGTLNNGWASVFTPASLPASFAGSGVVSASGPVQAIEEVTNRQSSGFGIAGGQARAIFQGISNPDTILYFPVAKLNWFGQDTIFYLQNAGSNPTTIEAVFFMGSAAAGTFHVYTATTPSVPPNQMVVVSPADARDSLGQSIPTTAAQGASNNTTMRNIGGMRATASEKLAGSYAEYSRGSITSLNATRALTSGDVETGAFAPSAKMFWYNRFTGFSIMNVDTQPINITVTFVGTSQYSGGNCVTLGHPYVDQKTNIQPMQVGLFLQYPGYTNVPRYCMMTAQISATGSFVAVINENNVSGATAGSVYYAAPNNSATTSSTNKLAFPHFVDQFNDAGVVMDGAAVIQNIDPANPATNVVATFYCYTAGNPATSWTAVSKPLTITVGNSFMFWRPQSYAPNKAQMATQFAATNALCSILVTGDQGDKLVGAYNEVSRTTGQADDENYEAFNLP